MKETSCQFGPNRSLAGILTEPASPMRRAAVVLVSAGVTPKFGPFRLYAELARRLGLNSAQVRKDLACFGQFGIPGFGYHVGELRRELRRILGKDREVRVVLVGVGNLGSALLSYRGFLKQGFTMLWGFDVNPEAARARSRSSIVIYDVEELETRLEGQHVDIAVLAVPDEVVQDIANRLVGLGIHAFLNFVPTRLEVPADVHVRYVDLSLELESLSFYVQDD